MRPLPILGLVAILALSGCGGDDEADPPPAQQGATGAATTTADGAATAAEPDGTTIVLRPSEFGTMLFGADRQAIYIFENDRKGETVCYGDCAEAWPPVLTDGDPVAGAGVDAALLGTVERRDGSLQVTYADQPLYYYAHEGPGEVRCHNVNLNGGFWWVIGPDGKRRA